VVSPRRRRLDRSPQFAAEVLVLLLVVLDQGLQPLTALLHDLDGLAARMLAQGRGVIEIVTHDLIVRNSREVMIIGTALVHDGLELAYMLTQLPIALLQLCHIKEPARVLLLLIVQEHGWP
jgi:hypothetical protein